MSSTTEIFKLAPRVLIVDNDARARQVYKELISHWGYTAIIAQGDGNFLFDDAKEKAKSFRCQLALVDLRLIDNFDDDDLSGLELARKIKPTVSIILSGYSNPIIVREIMEGTDAVSFVGKSERTQVLKEKIEREISKVCYQGKELKIEPIEIVQLIARRLFSNVHLDYHDQLLDAFTQLFPNAKRLRLEIIGTDHTISDSSNAPRPRSIVLKVYEDNLQPVIVKFARAEKTKVEIEHYDHHIRGQLVGNHIPVLQKHVILWDIGAAKFSYVGNIKQTFSHFYQSQPIEKIKYCLEHFFTHTWSEHYSRPKEQNNVSLFDMYCKVWNKKWYERVLVGSSSFDLGDVGARLPLKMNKPINPLAWIKLKVAENKDQDVSRVLKTYTAITHGDLHADNLMIDEHSNAWVIDFERCGEGHILQDFIELEADIINRISYSNENFSAFYNLCLVLLGQNSIKEINQENFAYSDPETRKVLSIVSLLRGLAFKCTGISDIRQYLFGLFFNTIFRATITSSGYHKKSQQRSLIFASLLSHRLEHWDEPWPFNEL